MLRRRNTYILVVTSASVGLFFLTFILKTTTFDVLYPHIVVSNEILAPPQPLVEVPLQTPEEPRINNAPLINKTSTDKQCSGDSVTYGDYRVISPYTNETRHTSDVGLVTLCTQGTVEFLQHVVVLCHRWSSPVSVAVYSPSDDYVDARIMAHTLRQCDSCVRYWVNWHFFFPAEVEVPKVDESQLTRDCSVITQMEKPKKRKSQGTYPINVGRNIARQLTSTPFVFSIDIELYPSLNIPSMFERMLRSQDQPALDTNQVWVLPVFEVRSKNRAPLHKSTLRSLFHQKQAISFHQYRCNICHRIPNLTQWLEYEEESSDSEVEEDLEPLQVWTTVKRSKKFKLQEWEPFFIGTTKDPEFDIRLSWEGKQNKMQMAYEMCMRDYDFHIIRNAFLVHTPGINVFNATKEKDRRQYVRQNQKVIKMVRRKLIKEYGSTRGCS